MPVQFSIIGGAGFRAQYFLRIAEALPERFRVSGMVVRNETKGREMEERWGVSCYRTLEALLSKEQPDYVIVSVSGAAGAEYLLRLAELGIPALTETPPAGDLEGHRQLHRELTVKGARIQVAEQYPFHPMQEARLALARSGRLGRITETTVSISHLYHAAALMRGILDAGYKEARIRGMRFESEWVKGPDRGGPPEEDRLIPLRRELAWLDFGDSLGIYDFTKDQHRSWTRFNQLSIRGERGEILNQQVRIQTPDTLPLELELKRVNRGELENQEGYFLKGILLGDQWLYDNPFAPARLYDDELAIARCLQRMAEYARGGRSFYSLPEASQDWYLGALIEQAIQTGETVTAVKQCWAEG